MKNDTHRRAKVTAEHTAEAAALKKLWDASREELKARGHGTQEAFGHAFDIGNQAAVGFFLNGKTPLSLKAGVGFARGLRVPVSAFSSRLAALTGGAATVEAIGKSRPVDMIDALAALGRVLERDMPDTVRAEAAELLAQIAHQRGALRHLIELANLLQAVEGENLPSKQVAVTEDTPAASAEDQATPDKLGGSTGQSGGGTQWEPPTNIGTRVNRADRPRQEQRDVYPGKKKPASGKKQA